MIVAQPAAVPSQLTEANETLAAPPVQKQVPSLRQWAPSLLLLAVVIAIYYGVCGKLVLDWYQNPDFSYGFLVPPFAAFLAWSKRDVLARMHPKQSWGGVPLVFASVVMLFLGIYGAELFLSRISLVMLLAGLIWTLLGRAYLRELRFALLVLLLAIPLPAVVYNQITFPLQILASKAAAATLPLFGVPVMRDGNIIQLASMQLEVAEACSGIRSLMSLFTAAVFYGYFLEQRTSIRVVLALASIPIAVVANSARIVGTGLSVQYWDPDKALGFFHEFSGWVMFIVSLCCLYVLHRLLHLNKSIGAEKS